MPGAVAVEEVTGGKAMVRFVELPQALHGADPRWAPPVMAWERYRLDPHRNPYFERGDAVYLLVRRLGRPVGRVAAHIAEVGGEGRFGFFTCVDDVDAAAALVDAAQDWLDGHGCSSMTGPYSFRPDDEPGLLVDGFDVPGVTGRPWHPEWEARLIGDLGLTTVEEQPWWRLPAADLAAPSQGISTRAEPTSDGSNDSDGVAMPPRRDGGEARDEALGQAGGHGDRTAIGMARPDDDAGDGAPGHAGPYGDPRLVLPGVAAVPDVADGLRSSSLRTAWRLARRARAGDWETCTVVRCTVDPAVAIPELGTAAAAAGYRWVVAPWTPDRAAAPEAVHRIVRRTW